MSSDCQGMVGVFDGHGGKEVAIYCRQHLAEVFKGLSEASASNGMKSADPNDRLKENLRETFHAMDTKLRTKDAQEEIKQIKGGPPPQTAEEIHAEIQRDLQSCRESAADGGKINGAEARNVF